MVYILFDCDGVLVDTEAVAANVVTEWFKSCNYFLSADDFINEHTGKTFGSIFKELTDKGLLSEHYWKSDTIYKLEETIYSTIIPVEGIAECLEHLNDYEKAVISNSREKMVKQALEVTQLDKYFDVNKIISSEMVNQPKPDPGVYLLALERFKLDTSEVIAIEDSITGVRAATMAGIKTIGFAGGSHLKKGHDKQLLEAGASYIAYHARDIPIIIKEELN